MILALLSALSRIDAVKIWIALPVFLAPIILLSFYTFSKTLFGSKRTAIICSILFILFYGLNEGMWVFRTAPYPTIIVNLILAPITMTFVFRYLREGKIAYLFLSSFLGLTVAAVHLFGLIIFLLAISSLCIFHLFFQRKDRKFFRLRIMHIFLMAVLIVGPYLILRWPAIKIVNPYYLTKSFSDKPYYVETITQNLYYMNPKLLCSPHYLVSHPFQPRLMYLAAFLLTPFLLVYVKRYDWAVFLFSNMIMPPLITLNPILTPLLAKRITFILVDRLSYLEPFLLVTGFFLSTILFRAEKFLNAKKKNLFANLSVIILYLV